MAKKKNPFAALMATAQDQQGYFTTKQATEAGYAETNPSQHKSGSPGWRLMCPAGGACRLRGRVANAEGVAGHGWHELSRILGVRKVVSPPTEVGKAEGRRQQ